MAWAEQQKNIGACPATEAADVRRRTSSRVAAESLTRSPDPATGFALLSSATIAAAFDAYDKQNLRPGVCAGAVWDWWLCDLQRCGPSARPRDKARFQGAF